MKKVLILSLAYFPHVGGAEVAIREITSRIAPRDIEFHLLTLRFSRRELRRERIGNVVVHRVGGGSSRLSKFFFQFRAALAALRLHRRERFDLVWAVMAHSAGVPAALFKLSHPRVPYLLTLQEGDPPEAIERTMRPLWPLFARAFTRADAVQAISTFLADWARRRGFTGRLEVIGNGVDVARFARRAPEPEVVAVRERLGKLAGDCYLVTTSRLVEKNAVDDVIRALALLPPEVSFIIYGVGPDEAKLKALAKELGVEARARFMGQLSHERLPLALAACDIFIRPSRSEGMGNSFIEAMAAGLPVIATQEGGIADFLFDAKRDPEKEPTGFAVDRDAPEQIAAMVEYVRAHPDEAARTAENAKQLVVERYDWDHIAARMQALFLDLCASS
ncbi:MAG: glycosyltransferase family 4 protein [Patescibacteria group bacterium]|nr:glycosyltransferase family 4 protein [Patescibacteria group bacterium]MDE2057834.1 glycosyltransferase family 4 protein [Patescibacteria group bacterium]